MSNTRDRVRPHFQTSRSSSKKFSVVFSIVFSVFGSVVKYGLSYLIYYLAVSRCQRIPFLNNVILAVYQTSIAIQIKQ